MPVDADLLLLNTTTIDSGSDGLGSGTDATAGAGAIISLPEETELACLLELLPSNTAGEPGDADTLDVIVELSADGGATYDPGFTFRSFLGSELPDDTAAGDKTVRKAGLFRTPRADSGQSGVVKCRLNVTASDGSNWGVRASICDKFTPRSEDFKDSGVA